MLNDKIKFVKNIGFLYLICFILLVGLFVFYKSLPPEQARAGSSQNVAGFAWSENIGWLSLNSSNCDSDNNGLSDGAPAGCPAAGTTIPSYGVNIEESGAITGYAWSENIGWVQFNPTGPYPASPNYSVTLDEPTGQITGWARALAFADGWDGWIRFDSVSLDDESGVIAGYAWASDIVGWLRFSGGYGSGLLDFEQNNPPAVNGLSVNQGDYCSSPLRPILSWNFQDDVGDYQDAYDVQITGILDSCLPAPGTCSPGHSASSFSPVFPLAYNTSYSWRVKVWDNGGLDSAWSVSNNFTTALHAFPEPDFAPVSQKITKDEFTQFCSVQQTGVCLNNLSKCYNSAGAEISCVSKTFFWALPAGAEFGEGDNQATANPKIKFTGSGLQNVSLTITDEVGGCSITKQVRVTRPLPKWREVAP